MHALRVAAGEQGQLVAGDQVAGHDGAFDLQGVEHGQQVGHQGGGGIRHIVGVVHGQRLA